MADKNLKDVIELNCTEIKPGLIKAVYKVAGKEVAAETDRVASEFSFHAAVPGFRSGKAPLNIVKVKFAPQIKEELTRRFMTTALDKFAEDQKTEIVAFNLPEGEKMPGFESGKDLVMAMEFDIAPKFELPEYKGLKLDIEQAGVSDKEIDERIDSYKNMYAAYAEIETPAQAEDMLKVAYTSDFALTEDASATLKRQVESDENWVWLNEPETIPGAIKALTGAVKGKAYEFTAEYPADYRDAALAGKKVKYNVTVNAVQRRVPVSDMAELCKKMQVENEEKLREQVKESLVVDAEMKSLNVKREKAVKLLNEKIGALVLPPTLLAQEVQKELRRLANSAIKSEADAEQFKKDIETHKVEAEQAAKDRLSRIFVMQKIAKAENITVVEQELDMQIKGLSRYYGYKSQDLRKMLNENGGIEDMQMDILVAKVTDFLVANAAK